MTRFTRLIALLLAASLLQGCIVTTVTYKESYSPSYGSGYSGIGYSGGNISGYDAKPFYKADPRNYPEINGRPGHTEYYSLGREFRSGLNGGAKQVPIPVQ